MSRKTLTILSVIGLLVSVALEIRTRSNAVGEESDDHREYVS
ncbi:MAG: hypothetical protein V3R87_09375 [Dehalococcoidia bacterium]